MLSDVVNLLYSSSSVIFDWEKVRAKAGWVILFDSKQKQKPNDALNKEKQKP